MIRRLTMTTLAAALALTLAGCGDSSPSASTPAAPPVDVALLTILNADIQDEYRSEAIYRAVLLDLGPETRPFANVVWAEQQHARAVAGLFTERGLAVPASQWSAANVPRFATLREACAAGVENERANVALYDSQLGASLPEDVLRVIQNNRAASLVNHLPAFQRCS